MQASRLPVKRERSAFVRSPNKAQIRFTVAAARVGGLAVSSEKVGSVSTAHEGGGVVLDQLSSAGGHGCSDLGHITVDVIQQLLAEGILQKPKHVVTLMDGTNQALCKKFFVQGLDVAELDRDMTLGNGHERGAVVRLLHLVEVRSEGLASGAGADEAVVDRDWRER